MGEKDIISKEVIRHLAVDLATYLLQLDIDPDSLQLIETEQQRVEDRRADLVARVRERGGESFILHIEIQNNNDPAMPWRMLRYLSDIGLRYPNEPIRQHLIYIGEAPCAMPTGLKRHGLDYEYHLLDMRTVDCARFLDQKNPDALVLAILCDFKGRAPQLVVNQIFGELFELLGHNPKKLREYLRMIQVLSDNRNLKTEIEEAEKMLTEVRLENMPFYSTGVQKGECNILQRQLTRRFGPLDEAVRQRIENASSDQLELWADRVLDAGSLDEVLGE
jgi:hypothetical protein